MGTTAEKLAYLKETKNRIKQALETPYNVMRDYPALIKKYIDNQTTKVVSDGNCVNALDVPLVSLRVDGNSYQGENPNPDYPQDIEVIDGVNLFDINKLTQGTWNNAYALQRVTIWATKIDIGESYTIINYDTSKYNFSCGVSSSNGYNESATASDDSGWLTSSTYTITASTTGYLFIQIKTPTGKVIKPSDLLSSDFQIIKGRITKPYLPYGCIGLEHTNEDGSKSEIIPINLNGNIIAKVGDAKDLLKVYRNGDVEIGKKIVKIVLDGSENIKDEHRDGTDNTKLYRVSVGDIKLYSRIISNYFRYAYNWDINKNTIYVGGSRNIFIRVSKDEFSTIEEFKNWLSQQYNAGTPVYADYILETPQTIKLPSIKPIELWEGTNKFELITNLDTTFTTEYVINKNNILDEIQTAMLDAEIET